MAEQIIEVTISYDADAVEREFPRWPGEGDEPPFEPVAQLVRYLTDRIKETVHYPSMQRCVVDVLTVDHRTPPTPTTSSTAPNRDYF